MEPFANSGIENYSLIGKVFEDKNSCALCPYGATYTFTNPPGNNGLNRDVALKISGTNMTIKGKYFTTKFHKDGQQFVGMDFYIPETGNHFSLGGVLEVKDGRIAMNGLSMNPDADSFNTWSAWERY